MRPFYGPPGKQCVQSTSTFAMTKGTYTYLLQCIWREGGSNANPNLLFLCFDAIDVLVSRLLT